MKRAFKSELDGMTAALREQLKRPNARVPSLDLILVVARELVTKALTNGEFSRWEKPAFAFGDDRTIWFEGWPIGEWVSRTEMFRGQETGDDLVVLRVFDPNVRESIQWWVRTEDRLKHEGLFPERPKKRSVAQIERDKVEEPLARHLALIGHNVKRQVKCASGRIDILDLTENEIIECKADGFASDITQAVLQLRRYGLEFTDAKLAVAVPRVESDADWLVETLPHINIRIIELETLSRGVLQ